MRALGWYRPGAAVLVDAALAVAVAGAVTIAIRVAHEPVVERPPDAFAYVLGGLIGALLLLRRRWPLAVLFATVAVLMTYYVLDYAGIAPAVPLAAALFSAATAGRFRWAMLVAAAFVAGGLVARLSEFDMPVLPLTIAVINDAALLASIVLLGETLRSRRERAERADAEREREATRRVSQERLRIAREMHDGLGQTIASVSIQAGLADDVLDERPEQARAALRSIRQASSQALRELRTVLTVLRSEEEDAVRPGLAQLDELLDVARKTGLRVGKVVSGQPVQVAPTLDLTAYRVIQESLTNTIRHANAATVTVAVTYAPTTLTVEVTDDGAGGERRSTPPGFGLVGMTERVSALRGVLDAGFRPDGGFRVHVELPVEAGT